MPTYMRRDIRHLYSVDVIISPNHIVESMLPMHRYKWISVIVIEQKPCISINHLLCLRWFSILDNSLEHLCHFFGNRNLSLSGFCLCGFDDVSHINSSLQLMVNINNLFFNEKHPAVAECPLVNLLLNGVPYFLKLYYHLLRLLLFPVPDVIPARLNITLSIP